MWMQNQKMTTMDGKILAKVKQYWIHCLYVLLLMIITYHKLFWLILYALVITFLFKGGMYALKRISNEFLKKTSKGIFFFLFVFTMSISMKLLVGDIYRIPSSSMEDTLFAGDVILVNKLAYGPKLPRNPFEISWVNLLFYMNSRARVAMEEDWWPYKRLRGNKKIQQGDILVYQTSRTFSLVKRCVAVPGDTLSIVDGEVYTNSKKFESPSTIKKMYRLQIASKRTFYHQIDSLGIRTAIYPSAKEAGYLIAVLSQRDWNKIHQLPSVKNMEMILDAYDTKIRFFANSEDIKWTQDSMGPFVVPKKGMTIPLNATNYTLYIKAIREHEKVELTEINGYYFNEGEKVTEFTFGQDYFFVMGDNRKGSFDSRYIGFIPEENIVGKVWKIFNVIDF